MRDLGKMLQEAKNKPTEIKQRVRKAVSSTEWFAANMSAAEAEKILQRDAKPGDFLVRGTSSK